MTNDTYYREEAELRHRLGEASSSQIGVILVEAILLLAEVIQTKKEDESA